MEKRELQIGDVVQLSPKLNNHFAGCFMVVTEPKGFGAQGYVNALGSSQVVTADGMAYYRAKFEDMEYIGKAEWVRKDSSDPQ